MPEESRVIQVTNVAPTATKDQMLTLFGFIGNIDDIVFYPELETAATHSRVCYVKFQYPEDVGVSLHLSNTVFIDRALVVLPVLDGKIPDEKAALAALTNPAGINSVDSTGAKVDEVHRTIYVSNLSLSITPEQLLQLFGTQAGEVKYARMAGDEGFGSRAAFVEFTEQVSVMRALALTGQTVGDCLIRVAPADSAIAKPANTGMLGATSKELEQAMKKVNEAQPLISAVLDPDKRSRSRSRSRRSRSRRSRSKHRSRSRSRRRSRSRSHRSRRRSRSRSRSPKRRKSRSRSRGRRSRSKSRDRRRRSKSRSPKSSKPRRSRSREKTKKTGSKSRDDTPAEYKKDAGKRDSDQKKTSKELDRDCKQSSRRRSRSPKMPPSRKRSRSRSSSPSRSGRKGRDDRRRSRERSKERSDKGRSSRGETKGSERHSNKGRNGHDGDTERYPSHGSDRESKSSAPKSSRDEEHESDVDGSEPKLARNEDNASEDDASHTEDED